MQKIEKRKGKGLHSKLVPQRKATKKTLLMMKDAQNLNLIVKKFDKFLKRSKAKKFSKNRESKATSSWSVLLKRKERMIENLKMST